MMPPPAGSAPTVYAERDDEWVGVALLLDGGPRVDDEAEVLANGKLIAEAPHLVEALQCVLHQYVQLCGDHNVMGWPAMVRDAEALLRKVGAEPWDQG